MHRAGVAAAAMLLFVAACGADGADTDDSTAPGTNSPSTSASSDEPLSGTLTISSGESLSYWCDGKGSPAVLLEAGTDSGGTAAYSAAFIDPLVAETTVCTYDRLGTGTSDPPPRRPRNLRDLCAVQDEVLAQLPMRAPYVLVGQSGGGNLNIGCAARRPDRTAGLVTIDSYHDDPEDLRMEGFAWPDNPEFVDYVDYSEELDALRMPIGDFPVLVISATDADPGGERNQRYWLALSSQSRQVTIEGPHDLQQTAPEEVVAEIIAELRRLS